MIRAATEQDAGAIAAIYNWYIINTTITFEEEALSREQMAERIQSGLLQYPWLVWQREAGVQGFAFARPYHGRSAYRFSTETTIYLHRDCAGKGAGTALYLQLLQQLKRSGQHTLIAAIALPNPASIALHEKLGFEKVGHLAEVGYKFGRWIDVGYWQLL